MAALYIFRFLLACLLNLQCNDYVKTYPIDLSAGSQKCHLRGNGSSVLSGTCMPLFAHCTLTFPGNPHSVWHTALLNMFNRPTRLIMEGETRICTLAQD